MTENRPIDYDIVIMGESAPVNGFDWLNTFGDKFTTSLHATVALYLFTAMVTAPSILPQ